MLNPLKFRKFSARARHGVVTKADTAFATPQQHQRKSIPHSLSSFGMAIACQHTSGKCAIDDAEQNSLNHGAPAHLDLLCADGTTNASCAGRHRIFCFIMAPRFNDNGAACNKNGEAMPAMRQRSFAANNCINLPSNHHMMVLKIQHFASR